MAQLPRRGAVLTLLVYAVLAGLGGTILLGAAIAAAWSALGPPWRRHVEVARLAPGRTRLRGTLHARGGEAIALASGGAAVARRLVVAGELITTDVVAAELRDATGACRVELAGARIAGEVHVGTLRDLTAREAALPDGGLVVVEGTATVDPEDGGLVVAGTGGVPVRVTLVAPNGARPPLVLASAAGAALLLLSSVAIAAWRALGSPQ